ncbi:MAG: hypothetical protein ACLFRP_03840 [Puniceicoccaceae bacterium]
MPAGPRLLLALFWLAALPVASRADDSLLRELERRSPFLPPGYTENRPAPRVERQPPRIPLDRLYGFTGVVEMGGRRRFAFLDLKEKRGFWTETGEAGAAVRVERFDASPPRVYVTVDGRSGWLPLQKRDLKITQAPPPVPTPPDSGPPSPPSGRAENRGQEEEPPKVPVRRRVVVRQRD